MAISTRTLQIGDPAPFFALRDTSGELFILRDCAGKPMVLIFYAKDEIPDCSAIAADFRDRCAEFVAWGVNVVAISVDAPESRANFRRDRDIPFALLSDPGAKVTKQYGVCFEDTSHGRIELILQRTVILLDLNLRVTRIYSPPSFTDLATTVLQDVKRLFPETPATVVPMQAPVLLVPNVLSPEICQKLIQIWETAGNSDSGFMKADGDRTVGYIDHRFKKRRDHVISDDEIEVKRVLDILMQRRIFPEMEKAFHYKASRREDYKIACYDASQGGYFRAHRDNTSGGTAHRKFAMTLNLNAEEYLGGFLRFPEYGSHCYKPTTGSAVIFSCSLMHEATEVLAGRRFALLVFFYGEAEAKAREEYENRQQNDYQKIIVSQ